MSPRRWKPMKPQPHRPPPPKRGPLLHELPEARRALEEWEASGERTTRVPYVLSRDQMLARITWNPF
jgi:hypothetical protein